MCNVMYSGIIQLGFRVLSAGCFGARSIDIVTLAMRRIPFAAYMAAEVFGGRRWFHHKALPDDDQLGEHLLDVNEIMEAKWKGVDLEALSNLDDRSGANSLASTTSRLRSLVEAQKKAGGTAEPVHEGMSAEEIQFLREAAIHESRITKERDFARQSHATYEAYLAAEAVAKKAGLVDTEVNVVPSTEGNVDDDVLLATSTGDEDTGDSERDVPAFYDPSLTPSPITTVEVMNLGEAAPSQQDPSSGVYVIPSTDPSQWNTEDVIAWLEAFGEEGLMDEHMKDAFRMVKVDGNMLLMKVSPPDLFKVMRKWHVQRSNVKTRELAGQLVVDSQLVNNTIYLCFPYCR